MKISEFSNKFGVSNDAVRYYMELNLIIPEKKGGHYHFDKKCEAEIKEILKLKEMDFSLQEIKNIFNFKRIGKLTPYQQNKYYQSIFKGKLQDIDGKISKLITAKERLAEKLANLELKKDKNITIIGIDLAALSLFSCPNCNSDLLLAAERVEANQVIEGSLNCDCGESLQIKDGILHTNFANNDERCIEESHVQNYINATHPDYIDKVYHSLEWLYRQIDFEKMTGKVIMEPGSGYGFFLRQVYNDLPDDAIYICTDKNPEFNKYLKQILEMTGKRAKVIFITADLPELPLKDNVVDMIIDYTGSSGFSFENHGFLPELLNKYIKKKITLLGTYIIYHKFGPNNIVAESYREYFKYNNIRDNLLQLNYELEKENKPELETVKESPGKYERFAQPGDHIYSYQVIAKRWG